MLFRSIIADRKEMRLQADIRQQENSGDTMQKKQEKDSIRQILAIFKNKKAFLFVISLAIFSIAWLLINFFYVVKLENCGLPVEWMSLIILSYSAVQMRVLKKHAESEFSAENGAAYTAVMLHTVEQISPEIYENYRELLDNFRSAVKRMLEQYYDAKENKFAMDATSEKVFCDAVQKACAEYLLLAEKYQECIR